MLHATDYTVIGHEIKRTGDEEVRNLNFRILSCDSISTVRQEFGQSFVKKQALLPQFTCPSVVGSCFDVATRNGLSHVVFSSVIGSRFSLLDLRIASQFEAAFLHERSQSDLWQSVAQGSPEVDESGTAVS